MQCCCVLAELLVYCDVTAADYDAPVAENGDLTEKYFIIQKVIRELLPNVQGLLFLFCLAYIARCTFVCL